MVLSWPKILGACAWSLDVAHGSCIFLKSLGVYLCALSFNRAMNRDWKFYSESSFWSRGADVGVAVLSVSSFPERMLSSFWQPIIDM